MFRPVQPIVYYYLNQDYIAEFLCINKDKPEMHCNGKCYLKKELKKQKQTDKRKQGFTISLENYPIGFVFILRLSFNDEPYFSAENTFSYKNNYSYLFDYFSFHPPRA